MPKLDSLTICENAIVSPDNKKSYINIFDRIKTRDIPVIFPRMFIIIVVRGDNDKEFKEEINILDSNGNPVLKSPTEIQIKLKENKHTWVAGFSNLEFKTIGKYFIDVKIDGLTITDKEKDFIIIENI